MRDLNRMGHVSPPKLFAGIAVAVYVVTLGYFRSRHLDALAAWSGYAPEQLALAVNHPDLLAGGFPSGILTLLNSIVYHVYPLFDRAGVSVTTVWGAMIFLEVAVFAGSVVYAVRRLLPISGWPVAAVVAISYAGSSFLTPDMAQIQFPYYGWVYAFAHACFLIVVTETVRRNYLAAAGVLVLEFMIHPISAIFAGLFFVGACLLDYRKGGLKWTSEISASFLFVVIGCGVWTFYIASHATITGGAVDAKTFIALNHAQNYHWFPSYNGFYWEEFWYKLLPLLSTLCLIAWSFDSRILPTFVRPKLALGAIFLSAVCCIGLLIAETVSWPPLIKVALHRADTNVLLIGGLVLIPELVRDIREGNAVERFLSAYLLFFPLFFETGFTPLPVALRIGWGAYLAWRSREVGFGLRAAIALMALIVALLIFYSLAGLIPDPLSTHYTGLNGPLLGLAAIVTVLSFVLNSKERAGWRPVFQSLIVLFPVTMMALINAPKFDILHDKATLAIADSALDAQLWARTHTPEKSIFMVDPTFSYFWRDKSHRPSFGTPREWLLVSILYNSQEAILEEGFRRYRALGLPNPDYIYDPKNRRMAPLLDRITNDAEKRFYAMDRLDLERLAQAFGIRYFVFQASRLKGDPPLPVVFRNSHFVIAAVQ